MAAKIGSTYPRFLLSTIISIIFLTSPLFGQSSEYVSVGQCVLQIMKENQLTGNEMYELVKKDCERLMKSTKGVLFWKMVNGEWGWFKDGNEKTDLKYVI